MFFIIIIIIIFIFGSCETLIILLILLAVHQFIFQMMKGNSERHLTSVAYFLLINHIAQMLSLLLIHNNCLLLWILVSPTCSCNMWRAPVKKGTSHTGLFGDRVIEVGIGWNALFVNFEIFVLCLLSLQCNFLLIFKHFPTKNSCNFCGLSSYYNLSNGVGVWQCL